MSLPVTCLVVYASLSQVHRVKRHLYQSGVFVDMVRAPQCLVRGCSFALRCDETLLPAIRATSQELAIEIRGAFAEIATIGYSPLP
jgi:hypothetical protein